MINEFKKAVRVLKKFKVLFAQNTAGKTKRFVNNVSDLLPQVIILTRACM